MDGPSESSQSNSASTPSTQEKSPHHIDNVSHAKRPHMLNKTTGNDPMSHRIIEKRRRDRMNNCLADLSKLIPSYYLKKSRGRVEKTEIIEMAIKYLKHLQAHACNQIETCEVTAKQERHSNEIENFHIGYQDCMNETLEFLRDSEGLFSGDSLCVRLMNHLTKHCEGILKNEGYMTNKQTCSSSSSSSSGYHPNGSSTGSSSDGNGSSNNNGDIKENATESFTGNLSQSSTTGHLSHSPNLRTVLTGKAEEEPTYPSTERFFPDEREEGISCSGTPGSLDSGFCGVSEGSSASLRDMIHHQINPATLERLHGNNYLTSSGPASNNSSSGEDNNNLLYKFKSKMKHRFNVDLEHSVKKMRRDSSSSCGFSGYDKDRHQSASRSSSQSGSYSRSQKMYDHSKFSDEGSGCNGSSGDSLSAFIPPIQHNGGKFIEENVPIFVLNQKGSFYVPFAIGYSQVAAALTANNECSSTLHPISIYVRFPVPIKAPSSIPDPYGSTSPRSSNHGVPHTSPYHSSHRPRSRSNQRKDSDVQNEINDDRLKAERSPHSPASNGLLTVNPTPSRFYPSVPFLEKREAPLPDNSLPPPIQITNFTDTINPTAQTKGHSESFNSRNSLDSEVSSRSNRVAIKENTEERLIRDGRSFIDYPDSSSYLSAALHRESKFVWPYHISNQTYQG